MIIMIIMIVIYADDHYVTIVHFEFVEERGSKEKSTPGKELNRES